MYTQKAYLGYGRRMIMRYGFKSILIDRLKDIAAKRKYTIIFIWAAVICSMLNDHYMYEWELVRINMEYIYQGFVLMAINAFLYERYLTEKYEDRPGSPLWWVNIVNAIVVMVAIIGRECFLQADNMLGIYAFLMAGLIFLYGFAFIIELVYLGYNSSKGGRAFVKRLLFCLAGAILGVLATAIVYVLFTAIMSNFMEVGIENNWVVRIWIFAIVLPGFIIGMEWDN